MQASVVVAHGLSICASRTVEHRLSSCSTQAQFLHGMWDLPRPGIKPRSPTLAGSFFTKSKHAVLMLSLLLLSTCIGRDSVKHLALVYISTKIVGIDTQIFFADEER